MPLSRFLGTGFAVPDRVVTNDDLSQLMDTSDQWIRERTGIRERRWVREGETGAELALAASGRALESAGIAPTDVDAIVSGTHEPGTSHYELLRAFQHDDVLRRMLSEANVRGYRTHEFGDSVLLERSAGMAASEPLEEGP